MERSRSEGQAWILVGLLGLATVSSYLDRGIIGVVAPDIREDLQLSYTGLGLLQGIAFSFFFAIASLPMGRLVDAVNRRNLVITGIVLWSIAAMLCGVAQNYWELMLARAALGIGEACLLPAAYSMVADSFAPTRRGRPMSLIHLGTTIGASASSIIGGTLLTFWDGRTVSLPLIGDITTWRAVFLVSGMPGLLVAVLLLMLREPARGAQTVTDPADLTTVSYVEFLKSNSRLFIPLHINFAAIFFTVYAIALWSPSILQEVYGLTRGEAGVATGRTMLIGAVAGTLVSAYLGDLIVRRNVPQGRFALSAWAMVAVVAGIVTLFVPSSFAFLVGFGLITFAAGVMTANGYPALYDIVPTITRGRAVAGYMVVANIFGVGGGTFAVGAVNDTIMSGKSSLVHSVLLVTSFSGLILGMTFIFAWRRYAELRHQFLTTSS